MKFLFSHKFYLLILKTLMNNFYRCYLLFLINNITTAVINLY